MVKSENPHLSALQEVVLLRRVEPNLDTVGITQKLKRIADRLTAEQEGSLLLDRKLSDAAVRLLAKVILAELDDCWVRTSTEDGRTKITVMKLGQRRTR